jgi:acyl-CoA synthetase (AMP-forming)/AMP-acid ligase II
MIRLDADALRRKNAPLLLAQRARDTPEAIAFRSKHLGLYRNRTWRDYAVLVERCARALASLGLVAGERVAIMGDACEEWMVCDLAAQALGAVTYGIYPTASAAEVEYQMADGGATIFIAEDQEYVDRILPLADALPHLRNIVVIDDTALFAFSHEKLISYAELGKAGDGADLTWLAARVAEVDRNDALYAQYLREPFFKNNQPNEYFDPNRILDFFGRIFADPTPPLAAREKRWFGRWLLLKRNAPHRMRIRSAVNEGPSPLSGKKVDFY